MHSSVYAQSNYYSEELFKQDAKEFGQLLNEYFFSVADKSKSDEARAYYRKKALTLFIEHGSAYEENGILRPGAIVKIIDATDPSTYTTSLVRDFLRHFDNSENIHYKLKSVEIIGISNRGFEKTEINNCFLFRDHAPCVLYQFDGNIVSDVTTKSIVFYYQHNEYHEPKSDYFWEYRVGNIEVICDNM